MPIKACISRAYGSSGPAAINKLVAAGLVVDYDTNQGKNCVQYLLPLNGTRLLSKAPIYFDDFPSFQGKPLRSMELVDGSQMAVFGGVDIPSSLKVAWVVLKDDCNQTLAEFPISRLNRVLNGGKNLYFQNLPVDWRKSFVFITNTAGLSSSGLLFNIWTN